MKARPLYLKGKKLLADAGCDAPDFDAAQLFEKIFHMNRTDLLMHPEVPCDPTGEACYLEMIQRRCSGEPLQYLLGTWPFFGRMFRVGEGVLIPREETELLVQQAVEYCANRRAQVIDLCAGSGAIAVTCSCELPQTEVHAVELSSEAYHYLNQNNSRLCGGQVILQRIWRNKSNEDLRIFCQDH